MQAIHTSKPYKVPADSDELRSAIPGEPLDLKCRTMPDDELYRVVRRHTVDEITDWAEVDAECLDYVIECWINVVGPDGQPVACTRKQKLKLPQSVREELILGFAMGVRRARKNDGA